MSETVSPNHSDLKMCDAKERLRTYLQVPCGRDRQIEINSLIGRCDEN